MYKLLIIDDEPAICTSLQFVFEDEYLVFTAYSEQEATEIITREEIDVALLDLKLGVSNGIEILKRLKQIDDNVIVIIMTAYGSIRSSVDAIKAGAFYYLTKPIDTEELKMLLVNVVQYIDLKSRVNYLNAKLTEVYGVSGIISNSAPMNKVFQQIDKVKDIESNVLITGESGTGKELVAKAIHYSGQRRNEPFEVINCAAIPSELLESELFGYEKGAFTGAFTRKRGIFELADNGTIFLDEIGEMDIRLQSKLLRFVQEKELTPIGSASHKKVNVRIISATNRDLKSEVDHKRFREDLFFRLNVITIRIPALGERREDIPLLIQFFIDKYNKKMGKNICGLDDEALKTLCSYDYKGNVRELENIIERGIVFAEGSKLTLDDFPGEILLAQDKPRESRGSLIPVHVGDKIKEIEQKVITETLKSFKGDKQKTAKVLGVSERKLWYKIKQYEQGK